MYFGPAFYRTGMTGIVALTLEDKISVPVALGLNPDSELKQHLDHFILKMAETGIMNKIKQDWELASSGQGSKFQHSPEMGTVLGFENLSFPFVTLLCGTATALLLALIERAMFRRKRTENRPFSK